MQARMSDTDGGFVATVKGKPNGQKGRAYAQRMRELASSVAERNQRIQELKGRARRKVSSGRTPSSST